MFKCNKSHLHRIVIVFETFAHQSLFLCVYAFHYCAIHFQFPIRFISIWFFIQLHGSFGCCALYFVRSMELRWLFLYFSGFYRKKPFHYCWKPECTPRIHSLEREKSKKRWKNERDSFEVIIIIIIGWIPLQFAIHHHIHITIWY